MNLVFMGTPSFVVPILENLITSNYPIVGVFTKPDYVQGQRIIESPVKIQAKALQLPIFQFPRSRKAELAYTPFMEALTALKPDAVIVAAYGQLFPTQALSIAPFGFINVHPSLLPKYRGVSPIQGAILEGDEITGVSIMKMDEGIDTGPILAQLKVRIFIDDTFESLAKRLGYAGSKLLLETLPKWFRGEIIPQPQDNSIASYTKPTKKEQGLINWRLPAADIERFVRAYYPWPSAYTYFNGKLLKILKAEVYKSDLYIEAGKIFLNDQKVMVGTGSDALILKEIQLEGKKVLSSEKFIIGNPNLIGSTLSMHPTTLQNP